jgi:hypothetical protein
MTPDILKLLSNIADNKFTLNTKIGFEPKGIAYIGLMAFTVGFALLILKFLVFKNKA